MTRVFPVGKRHIRRKCKHMNTFIHNLNQYLFDHDYYDSASLFILIFKELPSKLYLLSIDSQRCCRFLEKEMKTVILHSLNSIEINTSNKKEEPTVSHYVLEGKLVIELANNYCLMYYSASSDMILVNKLKKIFLNLKKKNKRGQPEINLITTRKNEFDLDTVNVKRTHLNLDLFYNDDFKEIDSLIKKRLNKKNDKGIVLLHGAPGTGKTTYLRYLIARIKKRVLFIPPYMAGRLSDPSLIQLLINNPNSVLVIEDAENIIMQRQAGIDSSVSNLLNISDGLLSDFLNIQLICTFNSPISTVDDALLRKGRLIAKYEFGRLTTDKSQKLSDHLGFENTIRQPMTIAEIFNQQEKNFPPTTRSIGFSTSNSYSL